MGIRNSERLVKSEFTTDQDGNPTGGQSILTVVTSPGLSEKLGVESGGATLDAMIIHWQDGIVGEEGQNGAFVEDVIEAARQRIQFFNQGKFRCRENSIAITKLEEALQWLDWRTRSRLLAEVENTYVQREGEDG